MAKYKFLENNTSIFNRETNGSFIIGTCSLLEKEYEAWLSQGNIPDSEFTKDELYNKRYQEVTTKTSQILDNNGFVYNNVHFYTDLTAQFNWNCLMIQKDVLTYPFEIWDGEQHLTFNDSTSLLLFLQSAFQYVYEKRYEGKLIRDSLAGMTYNELLNFVDPRG